MKATVDIGLSGAAFTPGVTPRHLVQPSSENDTEGAVGERKENDRFLRELLVSPPWLAEGQVQTISCRIGVGAVALCPAFGGWTRGGHDLASSKAGRLSGSQLEDRN